MVFRPPLCDHTRNAQKPSLGGEEVHNHDLIHQAMEMIGFIARFVSVISFVLAAFIGVFRR